MGSNPATPTIFPNDFNGWPVKRKADEMSGKRPVSESPNRLTPFPERGSGELAPPSMPAFYDALLREELAAATGDPSRQMDALRKFAKRLSATIEARRNDKTNLDTEYQEGSQSITGDRYTDDAREKIEELLREVNADLSSQRMFISQFIHMRDERSLRERLLKGLGELTLASCLLSIDHLSEELNKIADLPNRIRALSSLSTTILTLFFYGNTGVPSITDKYFKEVDAQIARTKKS